MIELKQVSKSYGNRKVLDIDDLKFESGMIYAILGPNGSGKTTLLRILTGLDKEYHGEIYFDGDIKLPRKDLAFLPQKPHIFKMTALENVALSANIDVAREALERVGMKEFDNQKAGSLSEGEARKVAIARTLATQKKLILLDEPMAPIDIESMHLVEGFIKSAVKDNGSTIIFTTHSPQQALHIADRAIVLLDGKLAEIGLPKEVFTAPKNPKVEDFIKYWRL